MEMNHPIVKFIFHLCIISQLAKGNVITGVLAAVFLDCIYTSKPGISFMFSMMIGVFIYIFEDGGWKILIDTTWGFGMLACVWIYFMLLFITPLVAAHAPESFKQVMWITQIFRIYRSGGTDKSLEQNNDEYHNNFK